MEKINIGMGRGRFGVKQDSNFKPSLYQLKHEEAVRQKIMNSQYKHVFVPKVVKENDVVIKEVEKPRSININYLADDCQEYFTNGGICKQGLNCDKRHSTIALGSTYQCIGWTNGVCKLESSCIYRHSRDSREPEPVTPPSADKNYSTISQPNKSTQNQIIALRSKVTSNSNMHASSYPTTTTIGLGQVQGQHSKTLVPISSSTSIWTRSNSSQIQNSH